MPKLGFNLSRKKILLIGFLFIALLVIPLTVYLAQQQQETQSHANPATVLSFVPASAPGTPGQPVHFDVILSPGGNQVNFVKLAITFDPTKLEATDQSFVLNPDSGLSVVQAATVKNNIMTVVLNISGDPTKVITKDNTKIGSVSFNVVESAQGSTELSFDQTEVNSLNGSHNDAFGENVFLKGNQAEVTIGTGATATPTTAATATLTPTSAATGTPTPTSGAAATPGSNSAPVCESLAIDPSTVGIAPFEVTFTVTGNDEDGSVNKVTFNYGDGKTEDVTTGGGLGGDTLSLDQAHTYDTSGSFTATALLTDDASGVSDTSTCSLTVTVSAGGEATPSAAITPLEATGPNNKIIGLGAIGGILFLIGALLFLAL